jgi:hypothetical protein
VPRGQTTSRPRLESGPPIEEGLAVLPSWCRSVPGRGPALVIAPHGGLCARDLLTPEPAASLRGNDLHSGELARLVAERLDAALLANVASDRNDLDLNRVDEVRARAPWFLDAIAEHLDRIVAQHGRALVLIVHGWQIVEPRCDVGIGARLADARDAESRAARLTVSPEFVTTTLEALRRYGAAHGVRTTYGARWPAQSPNNVMQLFRRSPDGTRARDPSVLATLAASGRIEAVQLELGAPLRYPGAWRERFIDAAAHAFGAWLARCATPVAAPARPGADLAATRAARIIERATDRASHAIERATDPATHASERAIDRSPPRGAALQAFDRNAGEEGLGVVAGIGAMSPRELGARLLLLPGGQRMLLFTGHERIGAGPKDRVGGLEMRARAGGLDVRFRGPVLDVPDASRHFRAEAAQLDARVVDLELELCFAAQGETGYGAVEGDVRLAGRTWRIGAHGFTDPVLARPIAPAGSLRLTASFGDGMAITAELARPPHGANLRCLTRDGLREHVVADVAGPAAIVPGRLAGAFELRAHGGPALRCRPLGHVTILRPGPDGRPLHVTFGAARFTLDDGTEGGGFYEHGMPADGSGDDDDRSAQ